MNVQTRKSSVVERSVYIRGAGVVLEGELERPSEESGIVIFAHGSGSSRHSPRNQFVARLLRRANLGTLLFDLLSAEEEKEERHTGHLRFDIGLLARRLKGAATWLRSQVSDEVRLGFFGASTGGGAALVAAAELGEAISGVVSRGGRPDLAGEALPRVTAPTLLIVGALDYPVIEMNQDAYQQLTCEKQLHVVPNASHLFEEPGTLEEVAHLASDWFHFHLQPPKG